MTINEYAGMRLAEIRTRRSADPERLALICDVSLEQYAAYELGLTRMPFRVMMGLAIEFGVEITYFLAGYEVTASRENIDFKPGHVD